MDKLSAYLRRKMMISRIFGIFACLVAIAGLVLKLLEVIDEWLCLLLIVYSLGTIFSLNGNLQDIKVGNPWQRVNFACAILMYLFVVFIIIYGFCVGELTVNF